MIEHKTNRSVTAQGAATGAANAAQAAGRKHRAAQTTESVEFRVTRT